MTKKPIILLFIIVVLLLVSLAGCKSEKVEVGEEQFTNEVDGKVGTAVKDDEEKTMRDFNNIVKSDNEPFVIVKFIDENIQKVTKEDAVKMIESLEEVQEQYLEEYGEQLFMEDYQGELIGLSKGQESQLFFNEIKTEEIKNANLKELMDKILKGKYKLINMEGAFYPIIDYETLKIYNDYLSDEMKGYIDIKSIDSNNPTVLDASLVISFDELAERLIKTENYIKEYPDGIRYEELLRLFGVYLRFYLEGVDNTPIYDYETKEIKNEVLKSYKKTEAKKDTVTSNIVSKYISIIEENQNIIDNNVFSKITELYNEAIATLEEYK